MKLTEEMIRKLPLIEDEECDGEQLCEEAAMMYEKIMKKYMEDK